MSPSIAGDAGVARPISILVADDHPVLRFGIAHLLESEADIDVIGTAGSCEEACRIAAERHPDIVLLDLEMDDTEGAEAPRKLRSHDDCRIIVFTAHTDEPRILEVIRIGINGYLTKSATRSRLCEAIRIVAGGGMYLDPVVAPKITMLLAGHRQHAPPPETLTERERAVLKCIAAGRRNKQIARELFISERTVKFHASSVFAKLGASNRTEAVKIAVANDLIAY